MKSFFQLVLWALICTAALTAYGYGYVVIANKSSVVAGLQAQIDTKTETATRATSARAILAEIAGDEAAVQSYFVPETGIVSFIDDLETRARSLGATLKVRSVATSGAAKQPALALSLTIDGTFDAVMRTIGSIEYAPYDIAVSRLSLSQNDKNLWHVDLEVSVGSVSASAATSTPSAAPKTVSSAPTTHDYF